MYLLQYDNMTLTDDQNLMPNTVHLICHHFSLLKIAIFTFLCKTLTLLITSNIEKYNLIQQTALL
jgi:hypothetical protein